MDFQQLMGSPAIRIKLVAYFHTFVLVFAMSSWSSQSYLFYNILFIVSLFWTMQCKESIDAVHTAALINASSILFDIFNIIGFSFAHSAFASIFAIINLIARPFTVLLLNRELIDRGGNFLFFETNAVGPQQRSYEDIDRPNQSIPTNTQDPNIRNMF